MGGADCIISGLGAKRDDRLGLLRGLRGIENWRPRVSLFGVVLSNIWGGLDGGVTGLSSAVLLACCLYPGVPGVSSVLRSPFSRPCLVVSGY